jgi:hypothetical protein
MIQRHTFSIFNKKSITEKSDNILYKGVRIVDELATQFYYER